MSITAVIALFVVVAFVAGLLANIVWRLASQRQSLPCPSWLGWLVEMENPFTRVSQTQFIVEHLDLDSGMKILDAGCGPGRVTLPLANAVGPTGQIMALDMQKAMLAKVREKAEAASLSNIQGLQGSIEGGVLPSNTFDRAILVSVLGEIIDPSKALNELFRSLKPGGKLAIVEVIFDPHFQGRNRATKLAQAVGFETDSRFGKRLAYMLRLTKPTRTSTQ